MTQHNIHAAIVGTLFVFPLLAGGVGRVQAPEASARTRMERADIEMDTFSCGGRWVPVAAAMSPDGRYVAVARTDSSVRVVDTRLARPIGALMEGHSGRITFLTFAPDGETLAVGDEAGVFSLWKARSGSLLKVVRGEGGAVSGLAFVSGGKSLAVAGKMGGVALWDTTTGAKRRALTSQPVSLLTASGDGMRLAVWCGDSKVRVWQMADTKPPRELSGGAAEGNALALSPNGGQIALASSGGLEVVEVATGRRAAKLTGGLGDVSALAFSSDGMTLTAMERDVRADKPENRPGITRWSLPDTKLGRAVEFGWMPSRREAGLCALSSDGTRFFVADLTKGLRVWHLR